MMSMHSYKINNLGFTMYTKNFFLKKNEFNSKDIKIIFYEFLKTCWYKLLKNSTANNLL